MAEPIASICGTWGHWKQAADNRDEWVRPSGPLGALQRALHWLWFWGPLFFHRGRLHCLHPLDWLSLIRDRRATGSSRGAIAWMHSVATRERPKHV